MSAFIVGDKTINDVVTLAILKQGKHPEFLTTIDKLVFNSLGSKLIDINNDSVNHRYKSSEIVNNSFEYKVEKDINKIQLQKSLLCWHYQSCEKEDMSLVDSFRNELSLFSDSELEEIRNTEKWNTAYYGD